MIVSIVTPVLNGGPLFAQCLESVVRERQAARASGSGIEVEHIIADGGSTDGSIALAQSYGIDVVQEKGTDLHERINRAYFNSRGELIGFLGADDILLEGAIEAVVKAYRQSGRRWVVGGFRWIDVQGRSLGTMKAPPQWMKPEVHACLGWNLSSPMATFYNRSFFTELGGLDVRYQVSADYDLFTRALAREPFARIPGPIAGSRRSGTNMSVVKRDRIREENRHILETFGPRGDFRRMAARMLLKTWVNAGHPEWLVRKVLDRTQVRLGLKKSGYYD